MRLARRPATSSRSFGPARAGILAALVNGAALVAIGLRAIATAVPRLGDPPEVPGGPVRRAMEDGRLEVHFQPEIDLGTGAVAGAEALVRWSDPERGPIPPAIFIPVAEETGLIRPLGRWVTTEALGRLAEWTAAGLAGPGFRVAVNVSAAELAAPDFSRRVADAVGRTTCTPDQLCLEVTESMVMRDPDATCRLLRELSGLGVELALDDFGTGHSSMAHLQRFPLDVLEIDRSFVPASTRTGASRSCARSSRSPAGSACARSPRGSRRSPSGTCCARSPAPSARATSSRARSRPDRFAALLAAAGDRPARIPSALVRQGGAGAH